MRALDTRWHIGSAFLALFAASPALAESDAGVEGGVGCGGWATAVDGVEVPANIPSFQVTMFGPEADSGSVSLVRRTTAGDVLIEADVTTAPAYDAPGNIVYTLAPRAPLTVGVTHVFQWTSACGYEERPFNILPAIPLPAPPATLTATLVQTVREHRRDELFVRVDLELASDVLPWASALAFEVVVDESERATLFLPYGTTTRLTRQLFVRCAGRLESRTPNVDEGAHDFRAAVGGFGLAPALEVTTRATIDCAHPHYEHANTGVALTEDEIAALGTWAPPVGGDGGLYVDAAVTSSGDAAVGASDAGVTPPAPSCSASAPGPASRGHIGMLLLALAALLWRGCSRAKA